MGRTKGSKNGIQTIRTKNCIQCNTTFTPSYANFHKVKFCSMACSFKAGRIPGRLGKQGSEKQKEVMRSRTGSTHPRWITNRNNVIGRHTRGLHDSDYKIWRKYICFRDKYTCVLKDETCSGKIEVHHILRWKDYPELRYVVSNGVCVCHKHHPRTRIEEDLHIKIFQNKLANL